DPLQGDGVDDGPHPADAEHDEVQPEHHDQQRVEELSHRHYLTSKRRPNAGSRHAATSRLGTCTRRSRAMTDSTTPTITARASIPATKTPPSSQGLPVSTGRATRTMRAPKTNSLRAAPYRTMPRAGPLWSSTMTS